MISKPLVAASLRPIVLSLLAGGPGYGYEIIQKVTKVTDGHLQLTTGTLYPLLHSLENRGLLSGFERPAGPGPPRKYYRLTPKGRRALEKERSQWIIVNRALMSLWPAPNPASA